MTKAWTDEDGDMIRYWTSTEGVDGSGGPRIGVTERGGSEPNTEDVLSLVEYLGRAL